MSHRGAGIPAGIGPITTESGGIAAGVATILVGNGITAGPVAQEESDKADTTAMTKKNTLFIAPYFTIKTTSITTAKIIL